MTRIQLTNLPKGSKVLISDLVGVDIAGIRAITTAPEYREQYRQGVPIRTLKKAEWRKENGFNWLRLYWEVDHKHDGFDCGFSGWREDCDALKTRSIEIV